MNLFKKPRQVEPDKSPQQTGVSAGLPTPGAALPASTPASGDCFQRYFQGIAKERVLSLESGTQAFQLVGSDQSKAGPIGIILTSNNRPIGGVRFQFISDGQLFKVENVVDSNCQKVEDYSNATRGGDKNTLQNFDSLQLRLGNADYELRLDYDGRITADF